jgi:hypothetical protein
MLTKEQVAELKAANPGVELARVVVQGVEVVLKAPSRAQYKRFIKIGRQEGMRMEAAEDLCRDCVVFPGPEELPKLFEQKVALSMTLAGELSEMAGAAEEVERTFL